MAAKKAARKRAGAAKKAAPRNAATRRKSADARSRDAEASKPRVPWLSMGLAVACTMIWGTISWDLARSATWTPVRAKALSHGSLTTTGHDPGGETAWGGVTRRTQSYTVVSYELDGIAYEQKVPGRLELGSLTEGVVDPQDPGRWRWSGNSSRWWIVAVAGLCALFFVRRAARKWPRG